jgi:GxxExxY protein
MELNQLSSQIGQAALNVHNELGPGLLERVYRSCMAIELKNMGLEVKVDVSLPILYRKQKVHDEGFKIDLLVEDTVIVALKSVEILQDVHRKQILTYLRLAEKPLGLLINFQEHVNVISFPGKFPLQPQSQPDPLFRAKNKHYKPLTPLAALNPLDGMTSAAGGAKFTE